MLEYICKRCGSRMVRKMLVNDIVMYCPQCDRIEHLEDISLRSWKYEKLGLIDDE